MIRPILSLWLSLVLAAGAYAQKPAPALLITPLTGDFYVYTTYGDPGDGTSYPSNSLYVVTTAGIVLMDTPWDTTQCQPLLDSLYARHHQKPVFCIATHFHEDKTAGLDFFRRHGVATWSSEQTKELCRQRDKPQAQHVFTKDTVFTIGNHTFRTFYPGEGHTKDNIVIWFEKESILYGGCLIKSTEAPGLGNLSDANTAAWPRTMKKLMQAFPDPAFVVCGHLSWKDKRSLAYTLQLAEKYQQDHPSKN